MWAGLFLQDVSWTPGSGDPVACLLEAKLLYFSKKSTVKGMLSGRLNG
jgi:hypothetical protein